MFSALTISNIMPTKDTRTNPNAALPVDRRGVLVGDLAAEAEADFARVLGKCIRLSVPNVARTLKCPFFPGVTGLYTAAIASASNALAAVAGHIDTRVGRFGRVYA